MDDGKKRYHCRVEGCHKSFSTSGHLTRHAQNHSGVRKYRCDYPGCTSAFFRPDTLSQHKKIHIQRLANSSSASYDISMQHVGAQTQGIPVTIHHHIPPVAYNQTPPVLASSAVLISVPRIVIESPPLTLAEQALTYSPLEQRGFFSAPPSPSSRPASPMIPISQSRPSSPMIPLSMNDDDQQQQPLPSLASVVPPTLRPHLDSQSRTKQWLAQQNYNVSQPPQFQQLQTQLSPHSLQPLIRSPYESSSSGTTPNDQYLQPAQLSYKRSSSVSSAVSSKGSVSFLVD